MLGEPGRNAQDLWDIVGLGAQVAARPALDLAEDVALGAAELVQAAGGEVDGVELDEGVDEGGREVAQERESSTPGGGRRRRIAPRRRSIR